jgi:alkanesulfonate monooxygenase SsuD/methylene tetrahydromethanopterin reductase-like flavin-dependent oxidoreductase (luciferase family)
MVSPTPTEPTAALPELDRTGLGERPFKLGFFTHVTSPEPGAGPYTELKELFVGAEELGFDAGFVAQHHLSNGTGGRLPSPLIGLTSVAEHTSRIELGTAVATLPLEDPIRLAEDAAVLDIISGGRVQLGLGTGTANFAGYAAFGKDVERRHELYGENLRVLLSALAGEPIRNTDAVLSPDGRALVRRIWGTPGDPASARRAARSGTGALFGTSNLHARKHQRPIIDAYLEEWREHGAIDAPPSVRETLRPRLGGIRMIYPSTSRAAGIRELADFFDTVRPGVAKARGVAAEDLTVDDLIDGVNLRFGAAEEVAQSIKDDPALLPEISYLIPVTVVLIQARADRRAAAREVDRALAGLKVIAEEVGPLLGWSPANTSRP